MKKTIKDYNLKGKKVIIRCDFNVPIENGIVKDDTRIRKSLKTIRYARRNDAKIILLSHLGRVKTDDDKEKFLNYDLMVYIIVLFFTYNS